LYSNLFQLRILTKGNCNRKETVTLISSAYVREAIASEHLLLRTQHTSKCTATMANSSAGGK